MIKLKTGEVYFATRANSGDGAKGPWQYAAVKEDGKGRKEIVIWVQNKPQTLEAGGRFRIKTIYSVNFGPRKDNAGNWHDEVNVSADVEPVFDAGEASSSGMNTYAPSTTAYKELDDDGELPF